MPAQRAYADEWEKITGSAAAASASRMVSADDVGQVDEHADPLHLPDDLAAEVGEPAGGRLVGARVGPADVRVVGERQVAHAERVQHPQHAERGVDRVPALGAHQRGDPARRP